MYVEVLIVIPHLYELNCNFTTGIRKYCWTSESCYWYYWWTSLPLYHYTPNAAPQSPTNHPPSLDPPSSDPPKSSLNVLVMDFPSTLIICITHFYDKLLLLFWCGWIENCMMTIIGYIFENNIHEIPKVCCIAIWLIEFFITLVVLICSWLYLKKDILFFLFLLLIRVYWTRVKNIYWILRNSFVKYNFS